MSQDFIGLRVARWRDVAGMTQQQLADTVGVTAAYISMIENGKRAITKRSLLYDLASALQVSITDLTGQPIPPRTLEERAAYQVAPAVRASLDEADEPSAARSADLLADLSDQAMAARMACDWDALSQTLPSLIAETAILAAAGGEVGLGLHAQACVTAALALKPMGYVDLARLLAERAERAALQLGNPVHLAAARFAAGQCVLTSGSRRSSLNLARSAGEALQPEINDDAGLAWYGMLHLHAALSAASLGHHDDAYAHLGEAADAARGVDSDPWRMEFSTANVAVWRVGIALENGEAASAPALARQVDQTQLRTVHRRARLYIDTARGLYAADRQDDAVRALLAADALAAQEVRTRPAVREIVGQMARDSRRQGGSDHLRELLTRMGVNPFEPDDAHLA